MWLPGRVSIKWTAIFKARDIKCGTLLNPVEINPVSDWTGGSADLALALAAGTACSVALAFGMAFVAVIAGLFNGVHRVLGPGGLHRLHCLRPLLGFSDKGPTPGLY